jgi:TPR repeat protein
MQADSQAGANYLTMAASSGSASAARVLRSLYGKGKLLPQDCKKSIYFGALGARLIGIGSFAVDNATQEEVEYNLREFWGKGFQKGELWVDGKQVLTASCLTQAEFDAAVASSVPAFERAKAIMQEAQRQHDALYDAARARLPEIKAAYEKAVYGTQK